ncbi:MULTISPECIES: beta-propeller fold lactonase family protein [Niastella]|uniref:Beta-propeller fold lactonase family protein n=1 Tax=Niastella soli TaxID=2821487 RepID=A0ABS3YZP4_9BACT|nr:beta-propeller fold lactonase family protein [Niastella soli]MBO9203402.1 beta-propeller fold lactonase family protein [Niastella soli]
MSKQIPARMHASLWAIVICCLLVACNKGWLNEYSGSYKADTTGKVIDIIYLESNSSEWAQNSILGYRVYEGGQVVPMEEGPFLTGGTGIPGSQNAGSFNSDHEVRLTNDKRFLLAVNSGDNTISVFSIQSDGTLKLTPGSPISSGGETPVSIDIWQQYVIVLNKSNHPVLPTYSAPNYSVFTLKGDGSLVFVSKFELRNGISPGQVLVSRSGAFVYGSNTWGFDYSPPAERLNIFSIGNNGTFTAGPAAPSFDSNLPGALGLYESSDQHVLYVAFPFSAQFSFYDINKNDGSLTHAGDATARPGCSRFCTNRSKHSLFTANTIDNSVSLFDITDAHSPRKTGELSLKETGPAYAGYFGQYTTSQCVSLATSSNDQYLYVVSQHGNPDTTIGNYNYLHVLHIVEGNFQEQDEPLQLPVANKFRPRGLAVLGR